MIYYKVCVQKDLNILFTYSFEDELCVGQLVTVNFRNRDVCGIITEITGEVSEYLGDIKRISCVLPYSVRSEYVKFIEFVSSYTLNPIGSIFSLLIPFSVDSILDAEKKVKPVISKKKSLDCFVLNEEQQKASDQIRQYEDKFKVVLLHGITGSGKTAVYIDFIRLCIENSLKFQGLILVPEVSLSEDLALKISENVWCEVFIWHHGISKVKKKSIWKKALNGENIIVIGARSSLFIPFSDLKCIIIDEEHDTSFKQSDFPTYNARDMAIYLASCLKIPVILSSATPSVESYVNAKNKKYEYVSLKSRFFQGATLPKLIIEDRRNSGKSSILSQKSIELVNKSLSEQKQALIFVNRRGHTPKVLCSSCGWKVLCPSCETWLCYHKESNMFVCHKCGFKTNVFDSCSKCGEKSLSGIGVGVEKAKEEIEKIFPTSRILCLSSDNMDSPKKISYNLELIKSKKVDIIIGTQVIAKGHNFSDLNTVVITSVDSMLYGDDFRASERFFQLVAQVSGRAGRFSDSGDSFVVLETYNPKDRLLELVSSCDFEKFYETEISNRKSVGVPPFGKFISLIISSFSKSILESFAIELINKAKKHKNIRVLGPIIPSLYRLRSKYRLRILIFGRSSDMQAYVSSWLSEKKINKDVKITIDVDPHDFS